MELSYELSSYKPKNQEALQSFLSKAKETMDAGALKTAAYSGGILEGLVVSPQYATLGANWIGNKLGLRNDAEAVNAAKDIKQFYKEYSPIPKPVEDYFNFLQEQEPGLKDTGKITLVTPKKEELTELEESLKNLLKDIEELKNN